jgi:hypothetical protein
VLVSKESNLSFCCGDLTIASSAVRAIAPSSPQAQIRYALKRNSYNNKFILIHIIYNKKEIQFFKLA